MKWKSPTNGTKRVRSGFLLFPETILNQTRWLQWATWQEEFLFNDYMRSGGFWIKNFWIDK